MYCSVQRIAAGGDEYVPVPELYADRAQLILWRNLGISSGSNYPVVSVYTDAIFVVEHCRKRSKEMLLLPVRTYSAE